MDHLNFKHILIFLIIVLIIAIIILLLDINTLLNNCNIVVLD